MKKQLALTTSLLTLGLAGTAHAGDPGQGYVNLGVTTVETFDALAIQGRAGYNFKGYFGLEADGTFGVIDQEDDGLSTSLDYSVGAFARARLHTGPNSLVFVRGGYHATGISEEFGGFSGSIDLDGFAVGGGAEWLYNGKNGVRLEYTYLDGGEFDGGIDTFSLAYVRMF